MLPQFRSWPALALAGVILAAALFGGGLLAGKALEDGDQAPADSTPINFGASLPRTGPFGPTTDGDDAGLVRSSTGAPAPGSAEAEDAARGGYGYGGATVPESYWGCEAPLGSIIVDGRIDPEAAGITPRFLGNGFQLLHVNLRAEGDCGDDGQPTSGQPVLETGWRHIETGVTVWVNQRIFDDPVANVRWETSANVVADGYFFTVNAWNNHYYYAGDDVKPLPADGDVEAADIAPPQGPDPAIAPVLDIAIAQLAPGVPANCYYQQTEGTWADLAGFGVGDPRAAIPSGFTESNFRLFTFTPPAAGCDDNGAEAPEGDSFWAQWTGDSGRSYLEVNVYRYQPFEGESWPGNLDDWGANWTNSGYQFSVWGNNDRGGLGKDVILAIATALDPSFDQQCLITTTPLDAAALAGLGFNAPSAPDGFEAGKSSLIRRGVAAGCPGADEFTNFELNWSFHDSNGRTIQVYGWVNGNNRGSSDSWGYIHDFGIEWGDGTRNFSVWGNDPAGESMRDLVIAVALDIDPSLDIDSLGSDGGPRPLPIAEDAPTR